MTWCWIESRKWIALRLLKHRPIRNTGKPIPPKEGIGGVPKERGSQALSHRPTPLRQPIGIGGEAQIPREIRTFWPPGSVTWRRGAGYEMATEGTRHKHGR